MYDPRDPAVAESDFTALVAFLDTLPPGRLHDSVACARLHSLHLRHMFDGFGLRAVPNPEIRTWLQSLSFDEWLYSCGGQLYIVGPGESFRQVHLVRQRHGREPEIRLMPNRLPSLERLAS